MDALGAQQAKEGSPSMKSLISRLRFTVVPAFALVLLLVPMARADDSLAGNGAQPGSAVEQAGNPEVPESIASTISNEDLLVSTDLVITPNGEVKDVQTGETLTDPAIVGTSDAPPDPLAKSGGIRFIPVEVGDLRSEAEAMTADEIQSSSDSGWPAAAATTVGPPEGAAFRASPAAFTYSPSSFGPHWGTYLGEPAFFDGNGNRFALQATTVIDVSQWQGNIDWAKVKTSGVDAAIIRLGYSDSGIDTTALTNIAECKRLGIPFGVYLFSYAETEADGRAEANHVLTLLRQAGVTPSTLSYPVFYDLERWAYGTNPRHTSPSSPAAYQAVVDGWWSTMANAGFENLSLYSYTDMLKNELSSLSLRSKTHWAASYGATVAFEYPANFRGWQYTDAETIPGITVNVVDVSAFGNAEWVGELDLMWQYREEDIAVGVALATPYGRPVEYRFLEYDVARGAWRTFADWTRANWAGWASTPGTYWLHVEARDASTHKLLGSETIAFAYQAGTTRIAGTYAGWRSDGILLGAVSNNPRATTRIKIYDTATKQWVAQFTGPWAMWHPTKGVYWTHFEVYTSDGRLAQTITYPFGV